MDLNGFRVENLRMFIDFIDFCCFKLKDQCFSHIFLEGCYQNSFLVGKKNRCFFFAERT